MNNKTKTMILILVFTLLIGLASFGYDALSQRFSHLGNNLELVQNEKDGTEDVYKRQVYNRVGLGYRLRKKRRSRRV